jgi:hypothetical protein
MVGPVAFGFQTKLAPGRLQILKRLFPDRQHHAKDSAARCVRCRPQPAAMRFDDRAADRQPHAQAAGFGRVERFKEAVEIGLSSTRRYAPSSCLASSMAFAIASPLSISLCQTVSQAVHAIARWGPDAGYN